MRLCGMRPAEESPDGRGGDGGDTKTVHGSSASGEGVGNAEGAWLGKYIVCAATATYISEYHEECVRCMAPDGWKRRECSVRRIHRCHCSCPPKKKTIHMRARSRPTDMEWESTMQQTNAALRVPIPHCPFPIPRPDLLSQPCERLFPSEAIPPLHPTPEPNFKNASHPSPPRV